MNARLRGLFRKHGLLIGAIALLSAGLVGAARLSQKVPTIATIDVKESEFVEVQQFRGEVKALRSIAITAPSEAGELQVVAIVNDGALVKKGDVIVVFDKTKTEQELAQHRSSLKTAQAEIEQVRAEARLTTEAEVTAVMKARYQVEATRLEAGKQEIVSRIEGEKAKLNVSDAEQRLREAEEKQASNLTVSRAKVQSKLQAKKKTEYDLNRAERTLTVMTVKAPADGLLSLTQQWNPNGQATLKAGDRAWPGVSIAELPDMSTLRVTARVDETERGRLKSGQPVSVLMDAIPDRQFNGHIDQISTIASPDASVIWPMVRNFTLTVVVDESDPRIRPAMTSQITVVIDRIPKSIVVPPRAVFQKSTGFVVYMLNGSKFVERAVEIERRAGEQVLVGKGLRVGDRIALEDPTAERTGKQ
jgi:RND family efflux transporter MFP subunit